MWQSGGGYPRMSAFPPGENEFKPGCDLTGPVVPASPYPVPLSGLPEIACESYSMKTVAAVSCIVLLLLFATPALDIPAAAADLFQPNPAVSGDYGYYQVGSDPSGADVVFDGTFVGESPVTIPVFSGASPGHSIEVSKIGYITWMQSYSLNPEPGQTIQVFAPLQKSKLTGSIRVSSVPNGALVSLDGQNGQMAPWIYGDVPVGIHMVQAYLSGYSPYTTQVGVDPGQTSYVEAGLIPLGSVGTLQVISSPGGADLYVDDVYKGKTSLTVGNLASGNHTIDLKLTGYQDLSGKATVEQGQTTILSLTLTQSEAPLTGTVTVSSSPAGAGIFLDNEYKGLTRYDGPVVFTGILPGEHGVTVKLANYQEYTKQFEIVAGQTVAVSAVLTPAPMYPPDATIDIGSSPSGASAFVDNVFSGQTPATVRAVPPGHHTVLIRLDGYQDYNTSFNLNPGQSALISAALAPAPTPVPNPTGTPFPDTGLVVTILFLAGATIYLIRVIRPGAGM